MNINCTFPGTHINIKQPFNESDILYLQKIFLTNGFHNLTTENIDLGRNFIFKILNSLNYYKNVAIISNATYCNDSITNIKDIFSQEEYKIYNFLLEDFDFDFLIIDKFDNKNFVKIEEYLLELKIYKLIPIIISS